MPTIISSTFTINTRAFTSVLQNTWDAINPSRPQAEEPLLLDYNRIFSEIGNPHSTTARNTSGHNVLLLRFEDCLRFKKPEISDATALTAKIKTFVATLEKRAQESSLPFLLVTCPDSDARLANDDYLTLRKQLMTYLEQTLKKHKNVYCLSEEKIKAYYPDTQAYDGTSHELNRTGHIPFTETYYAALAHTVCRTLTAIERARETPLKLIILDCDNTLYQGVVSESSATLTPPFRYFQKLMVEQREHGVCLALCSRNREEDVINLFRESNNFPLSLERDIAAMEINLGTKPDSVARLLTHFSFDPSSVVFIDDRKDECEAVQQKFPTMGVVHLPEESKIQSYFSHFWPFDVSDTPVENGTNRTAFYQKKLYQPKEAKEEAYTALPGNNSTSVHWEQVDDKTSPLIARMAELTSKTNQLNFNKSPYTQKQLADLIDKNKHQCYMLDVEDDFDRLAQTGLLIYHVDSPSKTLIVDTFLLSCRVMHKGVEAKILQTLFAKAQANGIKNIRLPFKKADRNGPAEHVLRSIAGTTQTQIADMTYYILPVRSKTASITFQTPTANSIVDAKNHPEEKENSDNHFRPYLKIALDHAHSETHNAKSLPSDPQKLLLRWLCEITYHDIEPTVHLSSLGLDSTQLTLLKAKINNHFGTKINATTLMELDTIDSLLKHINQCVAQHHPLSLAQKGLWLENKMQADDRYSLIRIFDISGPLDAKKLQRALHEIIKRHDILRASIRESDNTPVMAFLPIDEQFNLQEERISVDSTDKRTKELAAMPFDCEEGPLIRAHLLQKDEIHHRLIINVHHIIFDGWSFALLIQELQTIYNALYDKHPHKLLPSAQFSDFVAQMRQPDPRKHQKLEFWDNQLDHYHGMTLQHNTLTTQRTLSKKAGKIPFELDRDVFLQLQDAASSQKTTPFTLLLSAFMIFLGNISNQTDVAVTTVMATRPDKFIHSIGYFVNLAMLRTSLAPDGLTGQGLLKQVEQTMSQIAHHTLPFAELAQHFHAKKINLTDLLQALFVYENYPDEKLQLKGLDVHEANLGNAITLSLSDNAKFNLVFYFQPLMRDEKFTAVVEYNQDLFDRPIIEAFISAFSTILTTVLNDSTKEILSYPMVLPHPEKNAPTEQKNDGTPEHTSPSSVLARFKEQVKHNPENMALLAKQTLASREEPEEKSTGDKITREVLAIFTDLLPTRPSLNDTFFEAGGNSVLFMQLLIQLNRHFNTQLSAHEILSGKGSAFDVAKLIAQKKSEEIYLPDAPSSLPRSPSAFFRPLATSPRPLNNVKLLKHGDGSKTPLLFIHPVGGHTLCYAALISALDDDQTCYGVEYPHDPNRLLPKNVEALAKAYIKSIKIKQPTGPYSIIGHSFGGMVAVEIARQLFDAGDKIDFVGILDTWVVSCLPDDDQFTLKLNILQKYGRKYAAHYKTDPMAETRFNHLQNIGFHYQPPNLEALPLTLFKARDDLPELGALDHPCNFWNRYATVRTFTLPGDHDTMLLPGQVEDLARCLQKSIGGHYGGATLHQHKNGEPAEFKEAPHHREIHANILNDDSSKEDGPLMPPAERQPRKSKCFDLCCFFSRAYNACLNNNAHQKNDSYTKLN